jgi:Leucine-rich repeat (LRR) protein
LLNALEYLDLGYNSNIDGPIPTELCEMTNLKYVALQGNMLSGLFPTCIDQWKSLEFFSILGNDISGSLPSTDAFCQLTNMQLFILDKNYLEGQLPSCISKWTNLVALSMSDNQFVDEVPAELAALTKLEKLYLDGNFFQGDPTAVINNLTSLKLLFIEENEFTGVLDENFVKDLQSLTVIDVSGNNFTSTTYGIPIHLFGLPELTIVDFSANQLKGKIPTDIPINSALRFLAVNQNMLVGDIPSQLKNLTVLEHLDLSNNKLHGPVYKELFEMKSLYHIFLSENPLLQAGSIPSELAQMSQLTELSMKNTNRTGPLPELLGFDFLFLLDLNTNHFSGIIPANYGKLPVIRHLLLNDNSNITGQIPVFNGTDNLGTVLLDGTNVIGDLSSICQLPTFTGTQDISTDVIMVADCSDSNSGLNCTCCQCCSDDQLVCSNPLVASLDWVSWILIVALFNGVCLQQFALFFLIFDPPLDNFAQSWEYGYQRQFRNFGINVSIMDAAPAIP